MLYVTERLPVKTYPYPDHSLHYLDFGAHPPWIKQLYQMQTANTYVQELAQKLLQKSSPTAGLKTRLTSVQQYLHDSTHHMTHIERAGLYGYLNFTNVPYTLELISDTFNSVYAACSARNLIDVGLQWQIDWNLNRLVGSKNGSLEESLVLQDSFKGLPPLQCAEEATLAAALAGFVGGIPEDKLVFIGSPVHVALFIRPTGSLKRGCLFDSKMLYFPSGMKKFGQSPKEKKSTYFARFGELWFIVHTSGYVNLHASPTIPDGEIKEYARELDDFFQI